MKILFNTYPVAFHTEGGGEMQLRAYQRYLPVDEITISLFNLWDPQFNQHDLVHFFSVMGGSWHFCHFVKQLNLPLVVTSSLWITEQTKTLYPFDEIKHQISLADKVITNSEMESEQLMKVFNFPPEKFSVVYNGIDPIFFTPTSPELFRTHFKFVDPFILNVANIEPRKNQLNLLTAMKSFKDYKLVTIGHIRDPLYAKKCFELGGNQFVFLGPLDHESEILRSAYSACELFALPSTLETPGLSALEAAAQGAKLVVTGIGAPKEYFSKYAYYVEQPDKAHEIAEGIQEMLKAPKTDDLTKHIAQFSWPQTIKSLMTVYNCLKR